MSLRQLMCIFGVVLVGAAASNQVQAQDPVPQTTLWSFLGIPQAMTAAQDNFANRNGNAPRRERTPNMRRIADPENLKSENPAIKRAAEIKKEEDLKKQKIKAVKYLTKIGCGCYNRDGSITDALLKALDDCTEEVRLETVKAITDAANGEACENCKGKSCCSEELSNKLYEMAYEKDDAGCFLEPSERVRIAAAEALRACCPGGGGEGYILEEGGEEPPVQQGTIGEGESGTPRPRGMGEGSNPPPAPPQPVPGTGTGTGLEFNPGVVPTVDDETGAAPAPALKSSRRTAAIYGGTPNIVQASGSTERTQSASVAFTRDAGQAAVPNTLPAAGQIVAQPAAPQQRPTFEQYGPAVAASVDLRNNQATIQFPNGDTVPVGSILRGYHVYAFTGRQAVGDFIVIQSTGGFAIVRAHGTTRLSKLVSGDDLVVLQ